MVSFPAKLGKGQGAKEIGHNLAREQPKFWHNLVRKRHNRAQFRVRMTKIRTQTSMRTKRGLGTILWAIDENMDTNLHFTSAV